MDDTHQVTQTPSDPPRPVTDELSHVAAELYKKNFELDETNKTLSLLQKIDEIILSTVTDIPQIAQQVTDLLIKEAGFAAVSILVLDKKKDKLITLAVSDLPQIEKINPSYNKKLYFTTAMEEDTNLMIRAVKNKSVITTPDLTEILIPDFSAEEIKEIQSTIGIKACVIYPLVIREEVIGIMVICLTQSEEVVPQFQKELMARLVEVVGIAIDNALLYQRIEETNERLQEVDKLKDEFVSLASHELRTPMTAIKSYIWLVLQQGNENLNEKQKEYLQNTYASTERLIKLVNDMLNVSRIESGRLLIDKKPVNIEQIVQETITEVLPTAAERGLTVSEEKPITALPNVNADGDKIKEVIMNLVGNSLKFTPPGGKITISFSEKDGMVEIHIADTGKGIKQEDIPKLFKKFGMIEGNYLETTIGQGTGLGLYISKSIIELHGGKISFTSEGENKGTIFSFSLQKA